MSVTTITRAKIADAIRGMCDSISAQADQIATEPSYTRSITITMHIDAGGIINYTVQHDMYPKVKTAWIDPNFKDRCSKIEINLQNP